LYPSAAEYQLVQVPIFNDNYAHILLDKTTGQVAAVDPADPDRIVEALKSSFGSDRLDTLLITHKVD
jgi:hydroxyacylglutathione hydrolase